MDSNSDEQTELLRNIWNQMKDMDRSLRNEIKESSERLGDRITTEVASVRQELGGRIDRMASEVTGVKHEVAGVKQELAAVKRELSARIDHLTDRVEAADKRLEIRIGDVSDDLKAVRAASQVTVELLLKNDARQEEEVALIRERVARLEQHAGLPALLR